MAAKRFVKSSIDWAAFAERVPAHEKAKFHLFKAKVDGYTKRLMSYPEKPPAIDFSAYRARLPNRAMVDEFEKQVCFSYYWFVVNFIFVLLIYVVTGYQLYHQNPTTLFLQMGKAIIIFNSINLFYICNRFLKVSLEERK
ncbi:ATP synthase subunit d, mitochondrial-like [Stegodyphus dumicola]|uniref:ATP synthase subunit d, mitochondrial-like n=1 Tax=Stegodyphus dumicola TaxID=202533 RepID=UPI0015AA51C2|nr:ATP synthase subunit d, mitochondrial-like [Stegodyphus dumicola]